MCKTALDKSRELEAKYEQEDEEMMIRLIKIRQSLWT
jgi:aspartate/tyrosine/aromatic aminotransferase